MRQLSGKGRIAKQLADKDMLAGFIKMEIMRSYAASHDLAIVDGQAQSAKQRFMRAANYFPRKAIYPYGEVKA